MSHAVHHDPQVPKGALIAAAMLIAFTLALTAAVTSGWLAREGDPIGSRAAQNIAVAQQRALRFSDRADGAVLVSDAATGAVVSVIGFGEGGFVRATLRRLVKARRAAGIGPQPPFMLTRWANGALSLDDPATGKSAEIHGFGASHSAAFAAMLKAPGA